MSRFAMDQEKLRQVRQNMMLEAEQELEVVSADQVEDVVLNRSPPPESQELPEEGRYAGTEGEWHEPSEETESGLAANELDSGPLPALVERAGLAPGATVAVWDFYHIPTENPPGWELTERNFRVFEVTEEFLARGREMDR